MDPRMRPAAPRQYEEFDPETSPEGAETLLVHLPGFKKEQLRVQLTPSRLLKISGEQYIGGNKWKRFVKESRVPPGCDANEITVKLEAGVLYVRQPKLITPAEPTPAPAEKEDAEDAQKKREDAKEEKGKELEQAEARKAESEADTRNKNVELKKPVNGKIIVVMAVAAIALALHIAYINKVCRRYTTEEL